MMMVSATEPGVMNEETAEESTETFRGKDAQGLEHKTQEEELFVNDGSRELALPQVFEEEEELNLVAEEMAVPVIISKNAGRSGESLSEGEKNMQIDLQAVSKDAVNSTCASEDVIAVAEYYSIINDKNLTATANDKIQRMINDRWTKQKEFWENRERLKNGNAEMRRSGDSDYG